jgi:hypothetical protein
MKKRQWISSMLKDDPLLSHLSKVSVRRYIGCDQAYLVYSASGNPCTKFLVLVMRSSSNARSCA